MNIINLTTRTITEVNTHQVFKPAGLPVRLDTSSRQISLIDNIPIYTKYNAIVKDLPEEKEGTFYIVCGVMLNQIKRLGRTDFISPGQAVRDSSGKIIGCNGFLR